MSVSGLNKQSRKLLWKAVFILVVAFAAYEGATHAWDNYRLLGLESSWHGFGAQEKGFYNFTVVTALLDIGRGHWWTQSRTYNEYLSYLMQILKLDVNLIVYIQPQGQPFVQRVRRGREMRTVIKSLELEDLEYFPLLPRIADIMASPSFQANNTNYENSLVEATNPVYNLVTNSKVGLMHDAVSRNPFQTDYFLWLDGGYGHGDSSIYPPNGIWHPKHLLKHPDKVTFISFEDLSPSRIAEAKTLYKRKTAWLAGGLFGGGVGALERFYDLHKRMMYEYMKLGVIDDDQTTFVDCVLRAPDNFRPVRGDWYDLMKPFT